MPAMSVSIQFPPCSAFCLQTSTTSYIVLQTSSTGGELNWLNVKKIKFNFEIFHLTAFIILNRSPQLLQLRKDYHGFLHHRLHVFYKKYDIGVDKLVCITPRDYWSWRSPSASLGRRRKSLVPLSRQDQLGRDHPITGAVFTELKYFQCFLQLGTFGFCNIFWVIQ